MARKKRPFCIHGLSDFVTVLTKATLEDVGAGKIRRVYTYRCSKHKCDGCFTVTFKTGNGVAQANEREGG